MPTSQSIVPELQKLADAANRQHKEYHSCVDKGLKNHALPCGETLNAAKELVGDRHWLKWLSENCPDIAPLTARLYMRLASVAECRRPSAD